MSDMFTLFGQPRIRSTTHMPSMHSSGMANADSPNYGQRPLCLRFAEKKQKQLYSPKPTQHDCKRGVMAFGPPPLEGERCRSLGWKVLPQK